MHPVAQVVLDAILSGADDATIGYSSEMSGKVLYVEVSLHSKDGVLARVRMPFQEWVRAGQRTAPPFPPALEPAPQVLCRGHVSGLACLQYALPGSVFCELHKELHNTK